MLQWRSSELLTEEAFPVPKKRDPTARLNDDHDKYIDNTDCTMAH